MSKEINNLKQFLQDDQIAAAGELLNTYGSDWLKLYPPSPKCVLFPRSRHEVEQIVQWALRFNQALVPSGGRTGLSGGAAAQNNEAVVSFDKMNKILEFNEVESSLRVQPGAVTQMVQQTAQEKSLYFPLSFASEGSSQIGGNLATNAGGVHVIRYGSIRQWVLSLEVVTGRGEVLSLGRSLVKNAAGYNLMNLFIGSEGTLGFITEAVLKLAPLPPPKAVLLLAVPSLESLMQLYVLFKTQLALSAFEVFTDLAQSYTSNITSAAFPLKKSAYYALVECRQNDKEQTLTLFEKALQKQYISDGVMSESTKQAQELWSFRENISEALSPFSPYKNDVSVRPSLVPEFLSEVTVVLKKEYPHFPVVWFGHLGDGNLHINILKPASAALDAFLKQCEQASRVLFAVVQKYKGSISAEHGVGLLKKNSLHYSCPPEELNYMKAIKNIFDPKGILNPGKIFNL